MRAEIPDQLQVLARERSRLAGLLDADASWRALQDLADREARGEWRDAALQGAERGKLEATLSANVLYLAWCKLGDVINLLELASPGPSAQQLAAATAPAQLVAGAAHLTGIRGIDTALARRLAEQGVTTLAQVATWTAKDVKAVRTSLALGRRISQECWIEQAAMLLRQPEPVLAAAAFDKPADKAAKTSIALTEAAAAVFAAAANPAHVAVDAVGAATAFGGQTAPTDPSLTVFTAPAKPSSLTARLFARTPMPGPQRSLLAAIEAAEQARLRPGATVAEAVAQRHAELSMTQPAQPADVASAQTEAPVTAVAAGVVMRAGKDDGLARNELAGAPFETTVSETRLRNGTAAGLRSRAAADVDAEATATGRRSDRTARARPLLAPIEEEAEVVIVPRPGANKSPAPEAKARSRSGGDEQILDFDMEAQGGETVDPRNLAAHRGVIDEASVEIVVRKPGEPPREVTQVGRPVNSAPRDK